MGLLEKVRSYTGTSDDSETAHVILEKIGEGAYNTITPTRVLIASTISFLIASMTLFAVVWIVPYDNVNMDVAYMQSASGHVVLAELDNKGSRAIEEISVTMRLIDSSGVEKGRHDFEMDRLPAHSSISNTNSDDLELIVVGQSVWENHTVEIILEYKSYGGEVSERWTHEVGTWSREIFVNEATFSIF